MFKKKKGISPLIATVLIIGFTIVLAALVITWGTKLFKTTVGETETTSKLSLACTTGLNIEITPDTSEKANKKLYLTMRNNNQDRSIDDFQFLLYTSAGAEKVSVHGNAAGQFSSAAGTDAVAIKLEFPVPKKYTINANSDLATLNKVEVYPAFAIDGVTKACGSPIEVKIV
ncbi:hypothetical protein HYU23_02580 [Candidatus Woesearchaeota archaeon]|nr:hypothetical protein [Candidatus Woesearchaeota archaeon]